MRKSASEGWSTERPSQDQMARAIEKSKKNRKKLDASKMIGLRLIYALKYLELGWCIIPIGSKRKKPLIKWKKYQEQLPTEDEVISWWTKWPDANIAVVTGKISGLVVIDFDDETAYARFSKLFSKLPKTSTQKTRRGSHWVFRYDQRIKNIPGVIEKVDVLSDGKYFMVHPSIHPSGLRYKWNFNSPTVSGLDKIAALPEKIITQLIKFRPPSDNKSEFKNKTGAIIDGTRNETLFKIACSKISKNPRLELSDLYAIIQDINIKRCEPPKEDQEVRDIVKSAYKYRNKKEEIPIQKVEIKSAADILNMDLPEPEWIIDGILPEGLGILAGRPKVGKSLLILNLSISVATGGVALSKIDVNHGQVLYLALEDTLRRLKKRLKQMVPPETEDALYKDLFFSTLWPPMEQGGLVNLENQIKELENLRLVVIDTLALFSPKKGKRNTNQYKEDYAVVSRIKQIADAANISILLVHHLRKADASDVIDTISGTFGITGAADTLLVLQKCKEAYQLIITGRDVDGKDFVLERDNATLTYKLLGDASEVQPTLIRQKVLDILKSTNEQMKLKDITELVQENKPAVSKALKRLIEQDLVIQIKRGIYRIASSGN